MLGKKYLQLLDYKYLWNAESVINIEYEILSTCILNFQVSGLIMGFSLSFGSCKSSGAYKLGKGACAYNGKHMCIFVYDRWKTLHRQMATWRMRQRSWDPRHTQGPTLLPIQPPHLPPQALLADPEQLAHQGEDLSSNGYELLFTQIWTSPGVTADVIFIAYQIVGFFTEMVVSSKQKLWICAAHLLVYTISLLSLQKVLRLSNLFEMAIMQWSLYL